MRSLKVLLALALVAILAPAGRTAQPPQKPAAPPKNEKVAAIVNGETISESELTSAMNRQLRGREIPPEKAKELRQRMLGVIVDGRLIEQFLAKQKIQADPKAVDEVIDGLKKRVADAGMAFPDALARQGLTEQTLRQRISAELAFQKYTETAVNDAALQEYFKAHQTELDGSEVRASHVLVKYPEGATDADRKAAQTKIAAIRQEIVKGLDFADAAKKYSDCPSKSAGGDLGFFPRHNRMVEPFAAAAFALKKDAVSEPVESEFGWHLIKVTDHKPGDKKLNDVRDEVKEVVARGMWEKTAAEQRKTAKIEIKE